MLNKYNGRYYRLHDGDDLKLINSKRDKNLVGKHIYLRSPITCACGDTVCHKCFGTTSLLNIDISDKLNTVRLYGNIHDKTLLIAGNSR